jgi:regulator of sigma E protease
MLLTIISFVIVLTILVFVHESGHALAARHVGVRVQQFSIGFPPRMFGKKVGETEYVFSWIPLGGYVKLEGQNIEDENPNDPRNYASKSLLQRFYILVAGPVANLLLALAIMPLVYFVGVDTPAYRLAPADIVSTAPGSLSEEAGIQAGDRIVAVGEVETATWDDVFREMARQALLEDSVTVRAERGGHRIPHTLASAPLIEGKSIGWRPLIAPIAGSIAPDSAAEAAGMQPGDRIVSINGRPITRWDQIPREIQQGGGIPTAFTLQRGAETLHLQITPRPNPGTPKFLIGISPGRSKQRHGLVESVRLGTLRLWEITSATFVFLGRMLTGHGSMNAVGGPVKIAQYVGQAAQSGAANLIFLMAVISLQLGIFNLLPIPALDGGHIFMLAVELVKGSPLSAKLRERTQLIGFSLLILMLLLVTYNDIVQIVS